MTVYKTYASIQHSHHHWSYESHAEVVNGNNGDYLAVTLISELTDGSEGIAVQFTTTNGLMSSLQQRLPTVWSYDHCYWSPQQVRRDLLQQEDW